MSKYVVTDLVEAKPRKICTNLTPETYADGYKAIHSNGREAWYTKEEFERMSIKVGNNNMITQDFIDKYLEKSCVDVSTAIDGKTTIVHVILPNGFSIVESSACVDPTNYDQEVGEEICIAKIKDKLWELFGFLLQHSMNIKEEI